MSERSRSTSAVELLRRHPLLSRLSEPHLERFAQAGELELYHPEEEIVQAGSLGDALYLLLGGSATVHTPEGGAPIATLQAGEFFGEMSIIEPARRSATVRAADVCEVFRVPQFALANLLQDDPASMTWMLVMIIKVLSQRLRRANQLVGSVQELAEFLAGSLVQ